MTPDEARLFAPSFCSQNRAGGPGRQSKSLVLRLGKRLETDLSHLDHRHWVTPFGEITEKACSHTLGGRCPLGATSTELFRVKRHKFPDAHRRPAGQSLDAVRL